MMPRSSLDTRSLALAIPLALALGGCDRGRMGADIALGLERGRVYSDTLHWTTEGRRPDQVSSGAAVALGYLERQRLGLGSPFRLIDYALRDPRLSDVARQQLGWALLARTLDGAGYVVDSLVFEPSSGSADVAASWQLGLIEETIARASDPRSGELAVRLAYDLALAERQILPSTHATAVRVAGLLRDRELARRDARALLAAARRSGVSPLTLVPQWRQERLLAVEAPPLAAQDDRVQAEALTLEIGAARRLEDGAEQMPNARPVRIAPPPIPEAAAARLAELARSGSPPMAQVVVTLGAFRRRVMHEAALADDDAASAAAGRFLWRARNDESLAAEHALLRARATIGAAESATLAAAVALRSVAQEAPWFPGDGGPSVAELGSRFGITVAFDDGVPERWRPCYLTRLRDAITDAEQVVPALDLYGLRVQLSEWPSGSIALALHDPKRRMIILPVSTAAGALAHELAHDIDWQAARSRYAVRGDYATDRAVREQRGAIARSIRALATAPASIALADGAEESTPSDRPTEMFARAVDWFVASALASKGRSNGFLTSIQDDALTGYVSASPPGPTGDAAAALVAVLSEVLPLDTDSRDAFLARYGPAHALAPLELVRFVTRPVASRAAAPPSDDVVVLRDRAFVQLGRELCASRRRPSTWDARWALLARAAAARVTGLAVDEPEDALAEARLLERGRTPSQLRAECSSTSRH